MTITNTPKYMATINTLIDIIQRHKDDRLLIRFIPDHDDTVRIKTIILNKSTVDVEDIQLKSAKLATLNKLASACQQYKTEMGDDSPLSLFKECYYLHREFTLVKLNLENNLSSQVSTIMETDNNMLDKPIDQISISNTPVCIWTCDFTDFDLKDGGDLDETY